MTYTHFRKRGGLERGVPPPVALCWEGGRGGAVGLEREGPRFEEALWRRGNPTLAGGRGGGVPKLSCLTIFSPCIGRGAQCFGGVSSRIKRLKHREKEEKHGGRWGHKVVL